jgi:hypothetical protein
VMRDTRLNHAQATASSLRVVAVKATPAGRASIILSGTRVRRGLDAAERTRTTKVVAAPEIAARHGSPEIDRSRYHATTASRSILQHASRVIQCSCTMQKDFDRWNKTKKKLNAEIEPLYFREGEIWWVHLGVNVGYEIDGKKEKDRKSVV